ncbi:MAG: hypothetical protein H7287_08405 [Thermoleophilia bacterium]|nr:hypothetical protein [Thermoleophilia bacterium]
MPVTVAFVERRFDESVDVTPMVYDVPQWRLMDRYPRLLPPSVAGARPANVTA